MERLCFNSIKGRAGQSLRLMSVLILALVLAGFALLLVEGTVTADGNQAASIYLEPASQTAAGETFNVAIMIKNVDNLYAAEVHISFPADLLEVQDFDIDTLSFFLLHQDSSMKYLFYR